MGNPARKSEPEKSFSIIKKTEENSQKRLDDTLTEELIIGLCGPIGTDIHNVSKKIKEILENEYNYKVIEIRLSRIIELNTDIIQPYVKEHSKEYCRLKDLIERGNRLRQEYSPRILAESSIKRIGVDREIQREEFDRDNDPIHKKRRVCYIIDSIKNKHEYDLFKNAYRDLFYSFGIFAPKESRVHNLKVRGLREEEIYALIDQDSGEEIAYGQSVSETFMLSDFFIRLDNNVRKHLLSKIRRYFHLIFGTDIITPYPDETAMYLAASAASNSGCLSRQVGAAITDKYGDVLSVGWNDVPKFGGGVYISQKDEPDDSNDHRCKSLDPKLCFNTKNKNDIIDRITFNINLLYEEYENQLITFLETEFKENFTPAYKKKVLELSNTNFKFKLKKSIESSDLKNLTEYSRSIHAEMHAMIKGAQKSSDKMIGGKLFCTTFPCHNCARHIVMAGIMEVYYIEPYPKSLAEKLHFDSITTFEPDQNKVKIRMYDGVSPNRYMDLFKIKNEDRKKEHIKLSEARPKYQLTLENLQTLESLLGILLPEDFKYIET